MTDKTITDVLDDTVNHMANGIEQLTQAIQKIAPNAWGVLVKQQELLGKKDLVVGGLFAILFTVSLFYVLKYVKIYYRRSDEIAENNDKRSSGEGYAFLALFLLVWQLLCGVLMIAYFNAGWMKLNNPSYYAAEDLMQMIKKNDAQ